MQFEDKQSILCARISMCSRSREFCNLLVQIGFELHITTFRGYATSSQRELSSDLHYCTWHKYLHLLNPAPYTLHPAPCTLHPTPCTLHPAQQCGTAQHTALESPPSCHALTLDLEVHQARGQRIRPHTTPLCPCPCPCPSACSQATQRGGSSRCRCGRRGEGRTHERSKGVHRRSRGGLCCCRRSLGGGSGEIPEIIRRSSSGGSWGSRGGRSEVTKGVCGC